MTCRETGSSIKLRADNKHSQLQAHTSKGVGPEWGVEGMTGMRAMAAVIHAPAGPHQSIVHTACSGASRNHSQPAQQGCPLPPPPHPCQTGGSWQWSTGRSRCGAGRCGECRRPHPTPAREQVLLSHCGSCSDNIAWADVGTQENVLVWHSFKSIRASQQCQLEKRPAHRAMPAKAAAD